ncbi:IS3 family transposase [Deinococcus soli (ex Cha et al. 2016)]|uniref:IS3 family transposase n=1 Tax=Deinococcus soli (ex Cha et al. 2016) TaxID=1309411 RepID=UPI0012FEB51F|nr:IS3 family transposase [Deinococcus soli (ex Cha et al. 2016)]
MSPEQMPQVQTPIKRRVIQEVRHLFGISERRACRVLGFHRSTQRHRATRDDRDLADKLRTLACERPRFGYRRLHILLRRQGETVNHKRVYRVYRNEGLAVRKKTRRKGEAHTRLPLTSPTRANERWSLDFVSDQLANGQRFRILNVVDDGTRECVLSYASTSIPGSTVARLLADAIRERGKPEVLLTDNGPEFTGRALDQWAYSQGIAHHFIDPGKPVQNAYIESFNGRMRDEFLNVHWFLSVPQARLSLAIWRRDYNVVRPHSSLGNLTPHEFARQLAG